MSAHWSGTVNFLKLSTKEDISGDFSHVNKCSFQGKLSNRQYWCLQENEFCTREAGNISVKVIKYEIFFFCRTTFCMSDYKVIKTESARRWSNKWTKTLYQDYLHCIANFCRALLIIFSKQFISSNTKRRKRMLNFVWNT